MVRGRVVVLKVHSELFLFRCSYTDNGRLQAPNKKKSTHIYIYILFIYRKPPCFRFAFCCFAVTVFCV